MKYLKTSTLSPTAINLCSGLPLRIELMFKPNNGANSYLSEAHRWGRRQRIGPRHEGDSKSEKPVQTIEGNGWTVQCEQWKGRDGPWVCSQSELAERSAGRGQLTPHGYAGQKYYDLARLCGKWRNKRPALPNSLQWLPLFTPFPR